jgi:hypothetical protein
MAASKYSSIYFLLYYFSQVNSKQLLLSALSTPFVHPWVNRCIQNPLIFVFPRTMVLWLYDLVAYTTSTFGTADTAEASTLDHGFETDLDAV